MINVTTKSGTNSLNGVALWYTRNPKFNATPSGNNINTVVGLTNGPQSVYTRLAAIVRFSLFCIEDSIEGNVW